MSIEIDKNNLKLGFTTLGYLDVSPKYFLTKQKEILNKSDDDITPEYFKIGSAIHCKVLRPNDFSNEYYVSTFVAPTGKKADAVLFIANNKDRYENDGLTMEKLFEDALEFVDLKGKVDTIKKELTESPAYVNYFNALLNSKGKTILDSNDSFTVEQCNNSLNSNVYVNSVLYSNPLNNTLELVEKNILWSYKDLIIDSTPDKIIIDSTAKKIIVIDVKTTSKSPYKFMESYMKYGYYRQAAIYNKGVEFYLKENYEKPLDGFTFENYLVVVGVKGFESCVYSVSEEDLVLGFQEFDNQIELFKWHKEHNIWDIPKNIYENNGIVTLKLSDANGTTKN